jgi:hypothetical protein
MDSLSGTLVIIAIIALIVGEHVYYAIADLWCPKCYRFNAEKTGIAHSPLANAPKHDGAALEFQCRNCGHKFWRVVETRYN